LAANKQGKRNLFPPAVGRENHRNLFQVNVSKTQPLAPETLSKSPRAEGIAPGPRQVFFRKKCWQKSQK
jgi:hypothetical protein